MSMTTILLCVSAGEVFKWIGYIIVAMICFMFMIVVHELGHYTAGKILGFKINEFAIGFGPAIFKTTTNKQTGEVFSVRCIPAGGFCAFEGEDEEASSPDSFNSHPVWKRIIVLAAGVFFNFVSALIILNIFFMAYGEAAPVIVDTYDFVDAEHVQAFEQGDMIIKVNGTPVYSLLESGKLGELIAEADSNEFTVIRDGKEITFTAEKADYIYTYEDENGEIVTDVRKGLGITYGFGQYKLGYFSAVARSFNFCGDVVELIFKSIGQLFTGAAKVKDTMGGTITAVSALVQLGQSGFAAVAYGVAVLSVSIAFMNILPLPALDGSRIVFAVIEGIRKKPLNRKVEGMIHAVGLVLLIGLAITFDLLHFFG